MSATTRRAFLTTLAVAAAAPAALTGALAAPPALPTLPTEQMIALWARQCGWKGNPAWVMYDLLAARYGAEHLDRSSFATLAAYCDEPVTLSPPP